MPDDASAPPDAGAPPDRADVAFRYVVIDPDPPDHKHAKTVGDIDGDGFPDVVVAGAQDGDGMFWYRYSRWSKHEIVPAGVTGFTTDMQVGDVDGDGDLDVIVPKGFNKGSSVWWYENPRPGSDPTSDDWVEHSIGEAHAHDMEVADVDGDGRLDVVSRGGPTTLFLQKERGVWTRVRIATRPEEGLALGDVDGDGDVDVAIGTHWLENPLPAGNPALDAWAEHAVDTSRPERLGVHLADLDGDGRLDIVCAASESEGRLSWYPSPPDPKSGPWIERVIDPDAEYLHTFESADVDLDGELDLITAEMVQSSDPDEVSVYFNDGDGTAWTKLVVATTGSHNVRVADIGADGDVDIVGANWHGAAPLEMWRNDLFASWERHVIDHARPWRAVFVRMGDLDGDGGPDIATGGWWYRNPGTPGAIWERGAFGTPLHNVAILHDFDGDGDLDAFGTQGGAALTSDELAWAENDGSGRFAVRTNIERAAGNFLQGATIYAPSPGASLAAALSWHDARVGIQLVDVPGDPVAEEWTWRTIAPTGLGEDLSAADIDADGLEDLMLGTSWLRNDGGSWSAHPMDTAFPSPDRHALVDVDGDGRLDVVVGEESPDEVGTVSWFRQPAIPTGRWARHDISSAVVGGGMSLDAGDLDLDGDADVVVGEHGTTPSGESHLRVLLFENVDGSGERWREHVLGQGDEHHDGTQLVDIDADGDLDIVSIGWTHDRVLVYENPTRR